MFPAVSEAHPADQLIDPRLLGRAARQAERQEDVLLGRQHRQQIEELKDEADVPAPQFGELGVAERADLRAVDPRLAAAGPIEPGEQVHQRRLARARRPHHRDQRPLRHRQGDASERIDGHVAVAVAAGQVTRGDANRRLAQRLRRCGLPGGCGVHLGPRFRVVDHA